MTDMPAETEETPDVDRDQVARAVVTAMWITFTVGAVLAWALQPWVIVLFGVATALAAWFTPPLWAHFGRRRRDAQERIVVALWALSPHSEPSWSYGLDLMRICRMRSGRFYPALGRLEAEGLVEAKWEPVGEIGAHARPRRRMYRPVRQGPA